MEVIRAETAGFCMGVVLALQKLDALVEMGARNGPIYTLGPIIHNPQVLDEYARKGVAVIQSPGEAAGPATVVIRAHGIPRDVKSALCQRGLTVVDATCPKVKKAQLLIGKQARQGRMLLLYGEESHPEVKGLLSFAAAGAFLFDSREKLSELPLEPDRQYCLAAQTTQDKRAFDAMAADLRQRGREDVMVLQTICDATRRRQEEAVKIAMDMELMVVVGGYTSGNTRRLAQVVADRRVPVLHVETAQDLPLDKVRHLARIGLTAGASTPKKVVDEVHAALLDAACVPETGAEGAMALN